MADEIRVRLTKRRDLAGQAPADPRHSCGQPLREQGCAGGLAVYWCPHCSISGYARVEQ